MRSLQFIPNIFGMQKYARRRIKPKLVGSQGARRWSLVLAKLLIASHQKQVTSNQQLVTRNRQYLC